MKKNADRSASSTHFTLSRARHSSFFMAETLHNPLISRICTTLHINQTIFFREGTLESHSIPMEQKTRRLETRRHDFQCERIIFVSDRAPKPHCTLVRHQYFHGEPFFFQPNIVLQYLYCPSAKPSSPLVSADKQLSQINLILLLAKECIAYNAPVLLEHHSTVISFEPLPHPVPQLFRIHLVSMAFIPDQLVVQLTQQGAIIAVRESAGHHGFLSRCSLWLNATSLPLRLDQSITSAHVSTVFKRIIASCLALAWLQAGFGAEPERSVVQISTFSQQPLWDAPWRFDEVRRSSGTGFVIKGKKIMTNAHVVSWARQLLVRRYQDPRPYVARVTYAAHDCDLAIIEPDDPKFFEGMEPLEIGDLPAVRSTVVTYGYPAGGEQISYTRGVVSRIEMQSYSHIGNRSYLAAQTDAAINPGNSGGPVIQDDKVVGVAFQGIPGLENAGFFITTD